MWHGVMAPAQHAVQHAQAGDELVAGLRGGGWQGTAADLRAVDIAGGPVAAARAAAELLARAFALPGE